MHDVALSDEEDDVLLVREGVFSGERKRVMFTQEFSKCWSNAAGRVFDGDAQIRSTLERRSLDRRQQRKQGRKKKEMIFENIPTYLRSSAGKGRSLNSAGSWNKANIVSCFKHLSHCHG